MTAETDRVRFSVAEMTEYLRDIFPQADVGETFLVEETVSPRARGFGCVFDDKHLRPGGTISGPAMFTLADLALYVAVLGESAGSSWR